MSGDLDGARGRLETASGPVDLFRLSWLAEQGIGDVARLPHTVRILLENLLRRAGSRDVSRRRRRRPRRLAPAGRRAGRWRSCRAGS